MARRPILEDIKDEMGRLGWGPRKRWPAWCCVIARTVTKWWQTEKAVSDPDTNRGEGWDQIIFLAQCRAPQKEVLQCTIAPMVVGEGKVVKCSQTFFDEPDCLNLKMSRPVRLKCIRHAKGCTLLQYGMRRIFLFCIRKWKELGVARVVVTNEQNIFLPSWTFAKLQVVKLNQIIGLGTVHSKTQREWYACATRIGRAMDASRHKWFDASRERLPHKAFSEF